MSNNLDKQNIFNFFKDKSFIEVLNHHNFIIDEPRNKDKDNKLEKVTIQSLNKTSQYWLLDTESTAFQLQGKKVEKIILEQTEDDVLNIIIIEMKSKNESDTYKKFKNSLEFVYILLHLLDGKANQKFNVFGILIAQEDKGWNRKENLKIFSSTSIRYIKRSFFTSNSEIEIEYQDLIAKITR